MTEKSLPKTLYLRRVRLRNMRCFKDVEVSFEQADGKPRPITLLLGGNGAGKSTFLRALALGLCQQRETSGLIGHLAGDFIRQGKKGFSSDFASIELELLDPSNPKKLFSTTTTVTRDPSGQELTTRTTEPESFPWPAIFVCGYGVNRGAGQRETAPSEYQRADAVRTLFTDDAALLDPEEILKTLKLATFEADTPEANRRFDNIIKHLKYLLQLQGSYRIDVTSRQVSVHGPWGTMPFHALGDGYRGTSGWLLDLWSRAPSPTAYRRTANPQGSC